MIRALMCFFSEIKQEIVKVSWAKKEEIMYFLFLTIVIILCFSVFFCLVDFSFFYVIRVLLGVIYDI
ncbi:preprotein translocase subunit SecE [Candidatus Mesenet endosymbiont of Agriotes lineatus]|uniref:preprotein translocase subunit SecE n=1 Tax=Candidatus Mesenet endosymbiont of Agriotes lineatus TaxID=3077948 RepID=UPI0030CEF1AA